MGGGFAGDDLHGDVGFGDRAVHGLERRGRQEAIGAVVLVRSIHQCVERPATEATHRRQYSYLPSTPRNGRPGRNDERVDATRHGKKGTNLEAAVSEAESSLELALVGRKASYPKLVPDTVKAWPPEVLNALRSTAEEMASMAGGV